MALRAPADVAKWSAPRGELEIWLAAPEVVVQRVRGHAPVDFAEAIAAFNDRLIVAGKKPLIFDDWEEMTGYDSEARTRLTNWTQANLSTLRGIHILVRSKIVAMGIAVANLVTSGITVTYASRTEFEQALASGARRPESSLRS